MARKGCASVSDLRYYAVTSRNGCVSLLRSFYSSLRRRDRREGALMLSKRDYPQKNTKSTKKESAAVAAYGYCVAITFVIYVIFGGQIISRITRDCSQKKHSAAQPQPNSFFDRIT